jgi:hypothetical protein
MLLAICNAPGHSPILVSRGRDEIQVAGVRDLNDEDLRELLWSGPRRRWPVLMTGVALGLLAFAAHIIGTGLGLSEARQTDGGARSWQAEAAPQGPDLSWIPAGFRAVTDDGTAAFQIVTPIDLSCSAQGSSCIGYRIVTRDGCPSGFWLQVNVLNRMGVKMNEGWAIGPPVYPGEQAEVTVDWEGQPGSSYSIWDFQCRWSGSN